MCVDSVVAWLSCVHIRPMSCAHGGHSEPCLLHATLCAPLFHDTLSASRLRSIVCVRRRPPALLLPAPPPASTERAKNGPQQLQVRDLVWVYDDDDALFWPGKVMARTGAGYHVQMFVNQEAYVWVCTPHRYARAAVETDPVLPRVHARTSPTASILAWTCRSQG